VEMAFVSEADCSVRQGDHHQLELMNTGCEIKLAIDQIQIANDANLQKRNQTGHLIFFMLVFVSFFLFALFHLFCVSFLFDFSIVLPFFHLYLCLCFSVLATQLLL
jgi:hypothetical protein